MEQRKYAMLSNLLAVQIIRGEKTIEDVKFPELRAEVKEIVENNELLVHLFATRILNGVETIETVPETLRESVTLFLGRNTTNITLIVSDVLDGVMKIEDIPVEVKDIVISEIERYIGKKLG